MEQFPADPNQRWHDENDLAQTTPSHDPVSTPPDDASPTWPPAGSSSPAGAQPEPYQPYGIEPPAPAPDYQSVPSGQFAPSAQSAPLNQSAYPPPPQHQQGGPSYTPPPPPHTYPQGAPSYPPPYGAAPYPPAGYPPAYPPSPYGMRPTKVSGGAIAIEAILSLFGVFGVGWLMSHKTDVGAIVMILGFVWDVVAIAGTVITFGIGGCVVFPLHLIFVAATTIALSNQTAEG